MIYIAHRINTIDQLKQLPENVGVEIDLRDEGGTLILQHDPFKTGENFTEYCKEYKHRLMILNIKSERIESRVLEILKENNITEYFFLDSSFPMIYSLTQQGENNVALRYSEVEGIDTIVNMKGKALWVWVDCFTKFPLDQKTAATLTNSGFKLCLVSPELQGREKDIEKYAKIIKSNNIALDAICTKTRNIELWKTLLK